MDDIELLYHIDNLKACDPNYVVDVLGISSERLVDTFLEETLAFIKKDMG